MLAAKTEAWLTNELQPHVHNPLIAQAHAKDQGVRYFRYEAALFLALINSSSITFGAGTPSDAIRGSKNQKVLKSKIKVNKGKGNSMTDCSHTPPNRTPTSRVRDVQVTTERPSSGPICTTTWLATA